MKKEQNKPVLLTKIICYSLIVIAAIVGFVVIPKTLFSYDQTYKLAISLADIKDETMVFYDYKVYATESKYQTGLENDVKEQLTSFKERGEIMLVKIPGNEKSLKCEGEYWIETNPEVMELNIEYYLVPNIVFNGNSIPSRTAVSLVSNILSKVTIIYICAAAVVTLAIATPVSIGITRSLIALKKKEDDKNQDN